MSATELSCTKDENATCGDSVRQLPMTFCFCILRYLLLLFLQMRFSWCD